MIINYFRSSSYVRWDFCPMLYFVEYCLGWSGKSNKAADKGTIVHKVMEVLALVKLAKDNGKKYINHEIAGKVSLSPNINILTTKIYDYYSSALTHHDWTDKDYNDCKEWVWKAIKYNNGQFNPLKRDVIAAEPFFDFEIQEDWAKFTTKVNNEEKCGFLSIKGTIDLTTWVERGILEVVDYKTGKRLDWATGKEKTQESLQDDPQVRIYHYAAHKLYDVDQVFITVFYINYGGPFTICFDKSDFAKTEEIIKKRYVEIKNTVSPKLNKTWKCSKLCDAGKTTFEGTCVEPCIEFRKDREEYGCTMTKCEQVKYALEKDGIEKVMKEYTKGGFSVGEYKNPGDVE